MKLTGTINKLGSHKYIYLTILTYKVEILKKYYFKGLRIFLLKNVDGLIIDIMMKSRIFADESILTIGVFHAANRRHYSLNLDFAGMYKPIIVDRVIFKLINRCQIRQESFMTMEDGAVYLNEEGKRLFIREFEGKLRDKITIKEKTYTYEQVIENDIRAYVRHLRDGEDYKPYKYY